MKLVFPALLFLGALGECRYLGARPAGWAPPHPRRPVGGCLRPHSPSPHPSIPAPPAASRPPARGGARAGLRGAGAGVPRAAQSDPVPLCPSRNFGTHSTVAGFLHGRKMRPRDRE